MITERMQANLLWRYFTTDADCGAEIDLSLWRWPWREIFLHAEREESQLGGVILGQTGRDYLRNAVNLVAGADEEAARQWWHTIQESTEPIHYPTLAELAETLPPVRWLWPGWIPRGMITLLGAYQGTGKSYFVLDIARTVIHGGPWPDGAPAEKLGTVIYVDAEAIPQVNNERAVKLDLNRNRLYLLMPNNGEIFDLTNSRWQNRLTDMVHTLRPELIIIDSYSSISSSGQNSVEDTQRLLAYLSGLANYADAGFLVLHHLRKPPGGQLSLPGMSVHDFRGSGNITAMARSVMGLSVVQSGRQFSLNGPRRLDLVKTNLGPYPDPLGIELQTAPDGHVKFAYGAAPSFDAAADDDKPDPETWLIDFLETNGPTPYRDILAEAEAADINKTALYRARKKLGARVIDSKGKHLAGNQWLLAEQAAELEEPAEEEEDPVNV